VDLRRCDGCVGLEKPPQCTQACNLAHYVPEGMEWVEVYHTEINKHSGGTYFFPLHCQQCENPPCTNVCPVGATFATPEGPILIDQKRCIGCRMCMAACPYDRRFFNWGHPNQPPEAKARDAQYHPEEQVPAYIGTVMKCDMCPEMGRAGKVPYCVDGCPRGAIYYGDLEEDMASNGREIVKVSSYLAKNQAYRYKEHLGTQPRVYFIPGHGQDAGRNPYDPRESRRKELQWQRGP
ncbi:MAG: 4Fe-4S dicluster domain-containing protein, partial [Dehalococcoidia bacterium]|nr:4Fe-4S dicluster domain-containing protein [Dehalococcoidia bacterium]